MNVILPAPPPIIDEATFRVNQALENGEDLGQIQTQDQYFALIGRAVKKYKEQGGQPEKSDQLMTIIREDFEQLMPKGFQPPPLPPPMFWDQIADRVVDYMRAQQQ